MVMRRILGLEKKNRVYTPTRVEHELILAMEMRGLDRNNTVNIALEKHLQSMNVPVERLAIAPEAIAKA